MEKSAKIHHGRPNQDTFQVLPGSRREESSVHSWSPTKIMVCIQVSLKFSRQSETLRFTTNLWQTNKDNYVFLWMLAFSEHF
jgi:hypothetical protein